MDAQKKRFTLDLDSAFQRRLKVIAALKGISMRQYCLSAIEKEMGEDELEDVKSLPFGREALNRLAALQAEVFGEQEVPGDSTDLIREAREDRAKTL